MVFFVALVVICCFCALCRANSKRAEREKDDGGEGEEEDEDDEGEGEEDGGGGGEEIHVDVDADRCEEEREGAEERQEEDAKVFRLDPALSWEMSQAVAFRYAKKRTLFDLSLITRAELRRAGLVEGMLVSD